MNAANLERSARLQRVLALLSSGREFSTMEIVQQAKVMAVSAAVSELRAQGKTIHCERRGSIWYYRMQMPHMSRLEIMRAVGV